MANGAAMFDSIPPRQILADEVYTRLKALIMESSIAPGTRINIEDVARELGVSPTPVRESLARLESDGLVDKLPLRGYRTTELLGKADIADLYELRLLLEPHTARAAAEGIDEQAKRRLTVEIEAGRTAAGGTGYAAYFDLSNHDTRLHDLVLEIAGNSAIRQAYARTHCHLHTFRLGYSETFGSHTIDEHTALVEAIASGDGDAAEAAMRAHVSASRDRVLGQFENLTPLTHALARGGEQA